jgi:UDP:flavonoid glycosyltransferase YjiC (YdhE family)
VRVLFTAVAEVGHIVPMLGLARAARDAGHDVVLATHPTRHELVVEAGIEPVAAGLASSMVNEERLRRWPESQARPATEWGVRMWAEIAAPAMAADLVELIAAWQPDVLVHEEGEYGAPAAAARARLPWVTHAWGSPLRPDEGLRELDGHVDAAGFWDIAVERPPGAGLYAYAVIDPCPALLASPAAGSAAVWPVRPTIAGARAPAPGPSAERRVCYIGFGTVPAFANGTDIAAAADAALREGLDVIATVSDALLAASLAERGVDVRTFVALDELLPACAIAVTHGGAGTTLAALAHAVPVVAVPQGAPSQERMAEAVDRAGVGLVARGEGAIRAAIGRAVGDESLVRGAAAAAQQIAAMPPPGSVVANLEGLVATAP